MYLTLPPIEKMFDDLQYTSDVKTFVMTGATSVALLICVSRLTSRKGLRNMDSRVEDVTKSFSGTCSWHPGIFVPVEASVFTRAKLN